MAGQSPLQYSLGQQAPARIAVLRVLQLGDMLCAIPALRALRRGAPRAHITLIGMPWANILAERFHRYIDDFMSFPGYPGFPEQEPDIAALPRFLSEAQDRRFDLAIQMHGSGPLANPLTVMLGAARCAGYFVAGQYCPDAQLFLPWRESEPEVLRWIRLVTALGAAADGLHLEFPLSGADFRRLQQCRESLPAARTYACIHPGARLSSRRWPTARFAYVADGLAEEGLQIVLTGTAEEAALTAEVAHHMHASAWDLAGRTDLGSLAALVAGARLVISNDTGISHIAAAMKTPSVVVSCGSDPERWAPGDALRHRVIFEPVSCRPCMHVHCPLGHPCALGISPERVLSQARALNAEVQQQSAISVPL